ncbi:MAG: DUF5752 family protein [Candidatus Bathyarchaeota archaeon]|nr:DUF5752 family protein [Candidatus Bathyarchaeota archaeon]
MKQEHVRILKTMNEATSRMDLNMFAQAVNLEPTQAMAEVQELAKEGFLRRVGNGYGLTEKGRNALTVFTAFPSDKAFHFYIEVDKPLGFSAQSLEDFYRLVRQVCSDSLEFHLYRRDFENWIMLVIKDPELADAFASLKTAELKGEALRKALLKAIDAKYNVAELL